MSHKPLESSACDKMTLTTIQTFLLFESCCDIKDDDDNSWDLINTPLIVVSLDHLRHKEDKQTDRQTSAWIRPGQGNKAKVMTNEDSILSLKCGKMMPKDSNTAPIHPRPHATGVPVYLARYGCFKRRMLIYLITASGS